MAERKAKNKASEGILIQTLELKQIARSNVDIKKWRDALKAAEGQNENRKALYELFADMILDGHLISVMGKRIMSITNSNLQFTKDGKEVEGMDLLLKSKEFKKILKHIIEAKLYGHSLVEFTPDPTKTINFSSKRLDRRHVKPRLGIVVKNTGDTKGEFFREDPYYNFTLEVGEADDFGLLLQASQYIIYKRGGWGDWADFIQLFGIPFRHGKYENPETREVLGEALEGMGSAGYAVTPKDAEIEILRAEGATGANLVFKTFKQACNDEVSITILGQTMTTSDSGNAGFAQGKVHQAVEAEMHLDDKLDTLSILNTDVVRILANLGFPTEGGEFSYPDIDATTLKDRIAIDEKLVKLIPMPKTYFYNKYGIPVPSDGDTVGGEQTKEPQEPTKKDKKDKKLADGKDGLPSVSLEEKTRWNKFWSFLFS